MQYETAYNTLKQAIKDFDSSQIEGTTKEDIAAIIGADIGADFWSGGNEGFFVNLKRNLLEEKQRAEQQKEVDSVQQLLRKKYPKCDVVLDRDEMIVYLTGTVEVLPNG